MRIFLETYEARAWDRKIRLQAKKCSICLELLSAPASAAAEVICTWRSTPGWCAAPTNNWTEKTGHLATGEKVGQATDQAERLLAQLKWPRYFSPLRRPLRSSSANLPRLRAQKLFGDLRSNRRSWTCWGGLGCISLCSRKLAECDFALHKHHSTKFRTGD